MRFKGNIAAIAAIGSLVFAGSTYAQVESIDERVDRLERAFEARQTGQANMLQQLNNLQREISELRGITEDHANQLEQILERQRDLYQEIERRLSDNQGAAAPLTQPGVASGAGVTADDEESGYDRAIRLVLEERRYDQAIPEFQKFIASNPNSEYTGNAHYWLGQLFYVQENYKEAKNHFNTVITDFRDSTKRADCILKLGMIEVSEGNKAAARRYFERVKSEYPNSTEAGMASRQLDSLSK